MLQAGDESGAELGARVASLELQVGDLNHQLDNLTTELVKLRLRLESTRGELGDSIAAGRPAAAPTAAVVAVEQEVVAPPVAAPPPLPVFAAVDAPKVERKNLEERLGSQVFNAIGILALIFGASWALKLAIEHGMIGPVGRVLIGLAAGSGTILWSERFRRKGFAAFSYSLKAVGSGLLYLSLWAAFHIYGLLPGGVALAAMLVVTTWNAFMAWQQDSELLAVYALLGGFLTPALLSSGGDHETFLFTYIAGMVAATVALVRFKGWSRLLWISFPLTVVYFARWYSEFFHRGGTYGFDWPQKPGWDGQSSETLLFALLFSGLFAMVSVRAERVRSTLTAVYLPLGNAVFLGAALRALFEDSGDHALLAWVAVGMAAIYLTLMRLQATSVGRAVHLAIAVVALTIAIPLKASGHTLTTAWLVEGIVLYWLSTRMPIDEAKASAILRGLAVSGYGLGLCSLWVHWTFFRPEQGSLLSANLASALLAVVSLGGAVLVMRRSTTERRAARRGAMTTFLLALGAIDLVGLLLASNQVMNRQIEPALRTPFRSVDFSYALAGLIVLAGSFYTAYRLANEDRRGRDRLLVLAGVTMVLFNLTAILAIVREIDRLFTSTDAGLRQSLSTSAFLMVYGAGLLALGFWRRVSFIRWQGLALLIYTIAKVFLYDTWGLSRAYRPASFLGLGALLMAVSFAYQKDWLALKGTEEKMTDAAIAEGGAE